MGQPAAGGVPAALSRQWNLPHAYLNFVGLGGRFAEAAAEAAGAVHETMVDRASRTLPVSVRELAVLWTARAIGCSWCVDFGSMLQRLNGLDMERLQDLDNYATSPLFSDDERAAIAYADAMTADPHTVTDAQVAHLRAGFGDACRVPWEAPAFR